MSLKPEQQESSDSTLTKERIKKTQPMLFSLKPETKKETATLINLFKVKTHLCQTTINKLAKKEKKLANMIKKRTVFYEIAVKNSESEKKELEVLISKISSAPLLEKNKLQSLHGTREELEEELQSTNKEIGELQEFYYKQVGELRENIEFYKRGISRLEKVLNDYEMLIKRMQVQGGLGLGHYDELKNDLLFQQQGKKGQAATTASNSSENPKLNM